MDLKWLLESFIFISLVVLTFFQKSGRLAFTSKSKEYWFIDLFSLFLQGIVIPVLQTYVLYRAYTYLFPSYSSSLALPAVAVFCLNFVFVDYVYYLVHRFMHIKLWGFHLLHHSAENMDVMVTSRNTIWTPFLFPYIWLNSLFIFLLQDKSIYIFAVSLTAMLDLWRHSQLVKPKKSSFMKLISRVMMTPFEHSLHHSTTNCNVNYGANLNFWDKLHGTYEVSNELNKKIGIKARGSLVTKLFFPNKLYRENQ